MTTEIINSTIDPLIKKLESPDIYYINDTMLLIKLYKNKAFNDFLIDKPKFKLYHNDNNKYYRSVRYADDVPIPEHFITLCMIKNGNNNINLICCNVITENQKDKHFNDKESSGILLNGAFFVLPKFVDKNYYGLKDHKYDYNSIGYYRYSIDEDGIINRGQDGKVINFTDSETAFVHDPPSFDATSGIIKHSVQFAEEVCGMLTIDSNNIVQIMKFDDFKKNLEQNPLTLSDNQCLFGHLLVHNNDIIFTEDLMPIVYNLTESTRSVITSTIPPPLPLFTKCKLVIPDFSGNYKVMTPEDINKLRLNQSIYILNMGTGIIYNTKYSLTHIFTPYFMNLYKLSSAGSFAGDILPAMPSHASDLNPRTCIFRDKNDHVFFMHVEGRNPTYGGMGLDLFDLAKLCKDLGAVDAINLDGGGSSIMEIKEKNVPHSEHIGLYDYSIGNIIKITPK